MDTAYKNGILIVDDENSNIAALTQILSQDYNIYAAKNGMNAISAAIEYVPDVILLDILMPEMDGYETLAELKKDERTRNIPVIFVTGLDNAEDEEKGLACGAADYICKPFSPSIVKLRVGNQIKVSEAERFIKVMLDSSPLSMTIMNEKAEVIDCNQEALYMCGIANKEEYKAKFFEGISPEYQPSGELSRELGQKHLNMVLEKGYHRFEWEFKKTSGEPFHCEVTGIHAQLGNQSFIVTHRQNLRDIKELLEERNTLFVIGSILNVPDEMVYVTDADTDKIIFMNDCMKEHYNVEEDDIEPPCYTILQRDTEAVRCAFCPRDQLNKDSDKVIAWEERNSLIDHVYRKSGRYINWPNGNRVYLGKIADAPV